MGMPEPADFNAADLRAGRDGWMTSGASDIGREIVFGFAANGAHVFVVDVNEDGLAALEREASNIKTAICDMSNHTDIDPMALACLGIFEPVELRQTGLERRHWHAEETNERGANRCAAPAD